MLPIRVYKSAGVPSSPSAACFWPAGQRLALYAGLCWLYGCLHLDRQIPGILAEALKGNFLLRDQQLGALNGSAFSIVYALLGLYFGGRADRGDRLLLVRAGAWIWSLGCIGAAFAPDYALLIAARGGVAVGEAMATAAAVSFVSDLAGQGYRARATSGFFAFAFFGAGAAAMLGGAILARWRDSPALGWRAALVAAGLPGVCGALYLGAIARRDKRAAPVAATAGIAAPVLFAAAFGAIAVQMIWAPSVSVPACVMLALAVASYWASTLRRIDLPAYAGTLGLAAFRWLLGSFAAVLFVDVGATFWLLPYAQRRFGIGAGAAGAQLGSLIILGGLLGALLGGWCADRWRRRDPAGRVWTALAAVLTEGVAIWSALAQSDYRGFLAAFAVFCLASGGWTGVAAAIGIDIVSVAHRGTAAAAYFLITTVLGASLGPFVVGLCSDATGSLAAALAACCTMSLLAAVGLLRLGRMLTGASHDGSH